MLRCVDCHYPLTENWCSSCGRIYQQKNGVLIAWPKNLDKLAEEEAEHHDADDGDATEVHQLNRPRNYFYHKKLWQTMKTLPSGSNILEIGAGSGFDAKELVGDYRLTLTDVSPRTLARLREMMRDKEIWRDKEIEYIAADGSHLPFADQSFAGLYLVATFHHLPNPIIGIKEFNRVLQPGGQVCVAIEPNATYFRWIKYSRNFLCRIIHTLPPSKMAR